MKTKQWGDSNHYQYFIREGEEGGLGNRIGAYGQGHLCKN